MNEKEWLIDLWKKGLLCDKYKERVCKASSKRQLMDLLLDANGISFLQEMQAQGHCLPYEVITDKFRPYINGRYVYSSQQDGSGYTSVIYCCCDKKNVIVNSTNVCILGCNETVFELQDFSVTHLFIDKNSSITIHCPTHAKCYVDLWYGGKINEECIYKDNIIINRR